jgi:hypothetical protein
MTDNEMYEILNDFASQHALAAGLEVNVTPGGMSFKTVDFTVGGKYEYSHMLSDMIHGAEQLLMWARREGKVRFVRLDSKRAQLAHLSHKVDTICDKELAKEVAKKCMNPQSKSMQRGKNGR